jgi:hypothetical protein
MQDLITSFIIQSKECKLPQIGKFNVIVTPSESDIANKQITAPTFKIIFSGREEKISDGLIKYIAAKKKIGIAEALSEIQNWCSSIKGKLKNGEEILFAPLGILRKGPSGNLFIQNESNSLFFAPVAAERVIHKNSEHAMLVGDRETTSSVMNQFYNDEVIVAGNKTWKIIAAILLVIAIVLLFFYFYGHPFSISELGNHQKVVAPSAPNTYFSK